MIDTYGLALLTYHGRRDEWRRRIGQTFEPTEADIDEHLRMQDAHEREMAVQSLKRTHGTEDHPYEPTAEEIDRHIGKKAWQAAETALRLRHGGSVPTVGQIVNYLGSHDPRKDAIVSLKSEADFRFVEERSARRAEQLKRHYAERDAGREPLRATDLVSVSDGAERIGVAPEKLHHWIRNRELRVWGIPKHYRVSLAELKDYAVDMEADEWISQFF